MPLLRSVSKMERPARLSRTGEERLVAVATSAEHRVSNLCIVVSPYRSGPMMNEPVPWL